MTNFKTPTPDLQIAFYHRLMEIRKTYLVEALLECVEQLDISQIDSELKAFATNRSLQRMAGWGLRGEILFPVPCVLKNKPELLGYYRLLLGFSQKQFYGRQYGFARFKSMEERSVLTQKNSDDLNDFCKAICASSALLLEAVPTLSREIVHELTLLTLGPQLRGGSLNTLGAEATQRIFDLIHEIVKPTVEKAGKKENRRCQCGRARSENRVFKRSGHMHPGKASIWKFSQPGCDRNQRRARCIQHSQPDRGGGKKPPKSPEGRLCGVLDHGGRLSSKHGCRPKRIPDNGQILSHPENPGPRIGRLYRFPGKT